MNVQIWLPKDIENILLAIQEVMLSTSSVQSDQRRPEDYHQGFGDGLRSIAQSFGFKLLLLEKSLLPAKTRFSPHAAFWLREDIEKKLWTVQITMQAVCNKVGKDNRSSSYWEGFAAALHCVAAAFGIKLVDNVECVKVKY